MARPMTGRRVRGVRPVPIMGRGFLSDRPVRARSPLLCERISGTAQQPARVANRSQCDRRGCGQMPVRFQRLAVLSRRNATGVRCCRGRSVRMLCSLPVAQPSARDGRRRRAASEPGPPSRGRICRAPDCRWAYHPPRQGLTPGDVFLLLGHGNRRGPSFGRARTCGPSIDLRHDRRSLHW
jgi:hypothetical protein